MKRRVPWLLAVATACHATANMTASGDRDQSSPMEGAHADTALGGLGSIDSGAPSGDATDSPAAFAVYVEPVSNTPESLLPSTFGPFYSPPAFDVVIPRAVALAVDVTAEVTTSWLVNSIPTLTRKPSGSVHFRDGNGLVSFDASLTDGHANLRISPGDWTLAIRPAQGGLAPIDAAVHVSQGGSLSLVLPQGVAYWGRVLGPLGVPIPGVTVSIQTPDGILSGTTTTDLDGWYELHAAQDLGLVQIVVTPPASSRLPVLHRYVDTLEGSGRQDARWLTAELVNFSTSLTSSTGKPLEHIPVQISSRLLDSYKPVEAYWAVETTSDSRGFIDVRLPPGVYTMRVKPTLEQQVAARTIPTVAIHDTLDIGTTILQDFIEIEVPIVDTKGNALPGSSLYCHEIDGIGRTFASTIDSDGIASLRAPNAPLSCLFTPPVDRPDLASMRVVSAPDNLAQYAMGSGTRFSGSVAIAPNGHPAAYALVRIVNLDGDTLAETLTLADGTFQVRFQRDP